MKERSAAPFPVTLGYSNGLSATSRRAGSIPSAATSRSSRSATSAGRRRLRPRRASCSSGTRSSSPPSSSASRRMSLRQRLERQRDGSLVDAATEAIRTQICSRRARRRRPAAHRARARRGARRLAHGAPRGALEPRGARPDRDARDARAVRRLGRVVGAEPQHRLGLAAPARAGDPRGRRDPLGARGAGDPVDVRVGRDRRSPRRRPRSSASRQQALERGDPVAAADGDAAFHRLLSSYTKNGALRVLIDGLVDASRKGGVRRLLAAGDGRSARSSSTGGSSRRSPPPTSPRAAELARDHMIDAARQYAATQRELAADA